MLVPDTVCAMAAALPLARLMAHDDEEAEDHSTGFCTYRTSPLFVLQASEVQKELELKGPKKRLADATAEAEKKKPMQQKVTSFTAMRYIYIYIYIHLCVCVSSSTPLR